MTFFSFCEDDDCDDNCSKCGELMLNDNQNIRYVELHYPKYVPKNEYKN